MRVAAIALLLGPQILVCQALPCQAGSPQTIPASTAPARLLQPADLAARASAAVALQGGLDHLRESPVDGGQHLLAALSTAHRTLPDGSAARAALERIRQRPDDAAALAPAVADLLGDLTFRPVAQAELPAGVPGFQALDELELRTYPAYRMVRTGMRGGTMAAFWPLFRHIQDHGIAMTTPVQIDYAGDLQRDREASMAFLYGSPDLGAAGVDGKVEVVDVPPMTVLTVGSRGWDRPQRVAELKERLEAWLLQSGDWEAAGPIRTMGYNSPMVPGDRRYFEVQIPVRPRAAEHHSTLIELENSHGEPTMVRTSTR